MIGLTEVVAKSDWFNRKSERPQSAEGVGSGKRERQKECKQSMKIVLLIELPLSFILNMLQSSLCQTYPFRGE